MLKFIYTKIFIWSKKEGAKLGLDLPYFIKNSFWVVLRQSVGVISGLFLFMAFARLANQEVFGQYQLILSILATISIISIPGLNTSITQSVARGYEGDYRRAVKSSFLWSLIGIPLLLLVGGYYYMYQDQGMGIALMLSSIFFPFLYAFNTWDTFLLGKSRLDIAFRYGSIQAITSSVVVIGVIFFSPNNLLPITFSYLLGYSFFNILYFWKTLSYIENNKQDKDTLKYGWFLTKFNFLGTIANNIDKILVGVLLSPEILAVYAIVSFVAVRTKELLRPLMNSFLPKISSSKYSFKRFISKRGKIILALLGADLVFSLLFVFFIENVNFIFFGENYREYYYLSKYFFLVIFTSPIVYFLSVFARAKKDTKTIMSVNIFQYSSRILLNAIMIYYFGLFGAVLAMNISFVIWALSYVYFLNYHKSWA